MFKKISLITFLVLFLGTGAYAKGVTLRIGVTMPHVIVMDEEVELDEEEASREEHTMSRTVFVEKIIRNGQPIILKTIVAK